MKGVADRGGVEKGQRCDAKEHDSTAEKRRHQQLCQLRALQHLR
jgi:hypothetical protein